MKKWIAGILGAGLVLGVAPAMAGEWKLDTRRCSVVSERSFDRHDSRDYGRNDRYDRNDRGRRDSRSDRRGHGRDKMITVCPRSAWVYYPDRRELARGYDRHRGGYANSRYRSPVLQLSFDSNYGLQFRVDGGRRVYVR